MLQLYSEHPEYFQNLVRDQPWTRINLKKIEVFTGKSFNLPAPEENNIFSVVCSQKMWCVASLYHYTPIQTP